VVSGVLRFQPEDKHRSVLSRRTNGRSVHFFNATKGGRNIGKQLTASGYGRTLADVKHSDVLCMLAESSYIDWMLGGTKYTGTALPPLQGETMWMPSLAARHGRATVNHNNAYTNIAFFDGHVAEFATQPIEDYVNAAGVGGGPNIPKSLGVVFTLDQDQ
jgi:prepilin-type processing-associated H-X9-DG protein